MANLELQFHKMHGLGNDFIVIDNRNHDFDIEQLDFVALADRRTGIGCDQVLILDEDADDKFVARYDVVNADGTRAEQCGNGIRCLARFLHDRGDVGNDPFLINGPAGGVLMQCLGVGQYTANMGQPEFDPTLIPLNANAIDGKYQLDLTSGTIEIGSVAMGNPHAVIIDTPQFNEQLGAEISTHTTFPNRCNAGFVTIANSAEISLRVFERGAGPTRACGSGACAAVAVLHQLGLVDDTVTVHQPGGSLVIKWGGMGHDLWMTGPAAYVYKGKCEL